ncbi:Hypothetical_protein [Hexamita inflata]|uniref:Hypothetical_protein n=1 Tax=Hexamita inflata TaxID=28002 RepID=A0AA86U360_9EUKA|nr:Hypothetical protein HINF_LOCUS25741 [Hexamita inflata]
MKYEPQTARFTLTCRLLDIFWEISRGSVSEQGWGSAFEVMQQPRIETPTLVRIQTPEQFSKIARVSISESKSGSVWYISCVENFSLAFLQLYNIISQVLLTLLALPGQLPTGFGLINVVFYYTAVNDSMILYNSKSIMFGLFPIS